MALRAQKKVTTVDLLISDTGTGNPFAQQPYEGALENMIPFMGQLQRVAAMTNFHRSASGSKVWLIRDFKFTRNGAPEQQLLIFKSDGKVYKRRGGEETEVFPVGSGFAAFVQKPSAVVFADRLHVSDGSQYLIYDGWNWFKAGLVAPAAAPTTSLVAGSLTGTFQVAVTAVHIINTVRVHESNRSPLTAALSPAAQNIRVTVPPDLPARATSWSIYISELSGSTVFRRIATVDKNTSTFDISALPVGNESIAPVRNDPVKPSRFIAQWKNRLAMRAEDAQDRLWFTAFAEVKAGNNGSPEESLPGRLDSSLSDIINSWRLPARGERVKTAVWHDDYLFVFSDFTGYIVVGDGAILDNQGLRDFYPKRAFPFGAASFWSALSTPYGLVVMTPDRRIWLWTGRELQNIGLQIQKKLDAQAQADIDELEMHYWENNGRSWLMVPLNDRIAVFDFSLRPAPGDMGTWFSIGSQGAVAQPTAIGGYVPGVPILISGHTDGAVRHLDSIDQPAHVGLSAILSKCYFGATVQNSPATIARTASFTLEQGFWNEGKYVEIFHIAEGDSNATGIRSSNPTINVYYDGLDPNNPANAVPLTINTVTGSKERRAWLKPSATQSGGGALAKRYQVEVTWPAGADTDGQARPQLINNKIWSLGLAYQPQKDLRQ